jgi:hypothetical protein
VKVVLSAEEREQKLQDFIKSYMRQNRLNRGMRWSESRESHLTGALIAAGVNDMVSEVKRKINIALGLKESVV